MLCVLFPHFPNNIIATDTVIGRAIGLNLKYCLKSNLNKLSMALVVPQAGHGIPIKYRIGQGIFINHTANNTTTI